MEHFKSTFLRGIRLIAVVPSKDPKYNNPVATSVETTEKPLDAIPRLTEGWTMVDALDDVPAGWNSHVTPEGDLYWNDENRKIVSHADPRKPVVANLIDTAYENIRDKVKDWNDTEVFFNTTQAVPETPVSGALEYYVVNHPARQIFWVDEVKPNTVGIGPVTSLEQLKSALLSEYWTHMDYFPCHRAVDAESTRELKDVLRHGAIDDLTAPGSTFPYSSAECSRYLEFINGFEQTYKTPTESAFKTASIARVWATIARVRHINGYGMKNPRLDRFQDLDRFSHNQNRRSIRLRLAELGCFNTSRRLHTRMTELWNGRIVYQRHWHILFEELCGEWALAAMISVALLVASVLVIVSLEQKVSILHGLVASTAVTSLILSLVLHRIHQRSALATASDISSYISYAEGSFGLRGLSIVLSLPRALTIWGIILLQATITMELIPEFTGSYWWYKTSVTIGGPLVVLLPSISFFRPPV